MIMRRPDTRTIVFLDDDGEREIGRVVLPDGGVTAAEMQQFIEHLQREAKRKEHGPS